MKDFQVELDESDQLVLQKVRNLFFKYQEILTSEEIELLQKNSGNKKIISLKLLKKLKIIHQKFEEIDSLSQNYKEYKL